ncbi:MAG: hypothetical protein QG582_1375 [Candidatus Thermoplasmatota archaeon]|nr:hypothetical protein [Candidatus Thermoplasmatota archaeon]
MLMGTLAFVAGIALTDAAALIMAFAAMAVGIGFLVQGWLRIRRFTLAHPEVVSACASPAVTHTAPIERWKRTLLAVAFMLAGVLFLSGGAFLMADAEPYSVEILLLGIVFTVIGLSGLLVSVRR